MNITSVIDEATKKGLDWHQIWNSTVIEQLPDAVKRLELIAKVETVRLNASIDIPSLF